MRLTETAYETLDQNALKAKLSKADYIEYLILGKPPIIIEGLNGFLPQLKSLNRNINQIAILLHQGNMINPNVTEVKILYSNILVLLRQYRKELVNGNHQNEAPKGRER